MSVPPRVVMVSANFHPYIGGAEKQALELSRTLKASGVDVTVLTRRVGGLEPEQELDGITIRRLPAWGWGFVDSAVFMLSTTLWLLLNSRRYRAVHAHLAGSPALAAALAGRLLGKRVVVKLGGGRGIGEIAASSRTFLGRLKLKTLAGLDPRFVAVTRDLVEELREHRMPTGQAVIVPNGVDTVRYRPAKPEEKSALRAEFRWPAGTAFLYVGRLAPEKRLDLFLDQFAAAVKETGSDAFAVLVGQGGLESKLRELVEAFGLKGRVAFMKPTAEIAKVYRAADVFVLPSVSEGLSNALLEAMASGLAILGSRVGGTPEAVKDGGSGYLFEPRDHAAFRERLSQLMKTPGLAARLGAQAREDVAREFDLKAVAARYRELYGLTSR